MLTIIELRIGNYHLARGGLRLPKFMKNLQDQAILESLDTTVRSPQIQAFLEPAIMRVCTQLQSRPESVMAWEPLPLARFGALPSSIRSAWIFVLRGGANTGAERHPNSHQRMMSYVGTGDMQTRTAADQPWQSNVLISDPDAPLERRWISIPQNIWHQPVIPPGSDWVVVSFHTVPAEELIEERPDPERDTGMKQMHYVRPQKGDLTA